MLSILLACAAVVTAVVLVRHIRTAKVEWDLGSIFVFVVGFAYMVPMAAAKFTNSIVYRLGGPTNEPAVAGLGWADRLIMLSDYATVLMAGLGVTLAMVSGRPLKWSTLATPIVGVVLLATLVSAFKLQVPPTGQPLMLMLALTAAALVPTTKRAVANGAAALTLTAVILSSALAVVNPSAAFQACADKCTLVGEIFTGVSSHGNGLSLLITLGLPFVWFATEGKARYWFAAHLIFIVAMSGSRTALAAALLVVGVLSIMRVRVVGNTVQGKASWVGGLIATLAACLSLVVAILPHEDAYTTGRGYLWRIALEHFSTSPVVGTGLTTWSELFASGYFGPAAAYSTHNQWMEALLFSGLLGATVFAGILIIGVSQKESRLIVAPLLVAVFALGVFERPLSISLVDNLTWAMLGMVMLAGGGSKPEDREQVGSMAGRTALPSWAPTKSGELPTWVKSDR